MPNDVFYVDTDGFVIPDFGIGDPDSSKDDAPEVDSTPSHQVRSISWFCDWESTLLFLYPSCD